MKTRLSVKGKLAVCSLLWAMGNTGIAGVDRQVYTQSDVEKDRPTLMEAMAGWVNGLVPPSSRHASPSFRWIETPRVTNDPRLQQTEAEGQHGILARLPQVGRLQRVVAPGGMFRRVENAPASASKGDFSQSQGRGGLIVQQPNLALSANVPTGLGVSDADVVWRISSLNGGENRQLGGRSLHLSLPEGRYEVSLLIGSYAEQVVVEVARAKLAKPEFSANIGRLRASSSMQADWQVVALNGAAAGRKLMERKGDKQINDIVAAGEYEVVATVNSASQGQRLRVNRGAVSVANINVPVGKVNLVATLGNSPAMKPMRWTLYRLDGGRQEVASPKRHSAMLVVAPGHYEAVASLDGRERRREFTVLNGSSNNIVLAMD